MTRQKPQAAGHANPAPHLAATVADLTVGAANMSDPPAQTPHVPGDCRIRS
jgi:hypothetical protein